MRWRLVTCGAALLFLIGCSSEPPPSPEADRLQAIVVRLESIAERLEHPPIIYIVPMDPERQAGGGTSGLAGE